MKRKDRKRQSAEEKLLRHNPGKKDQRYRAQNKGKAEITFFLIRIHG